MVQFSQHQTSSTKGYKLKTKRTLWILIALYIISIYASLPYMRGFLELAYSYLDKGGLTLALNATFVLIAVLLLWLLWLRGIGRFLVLAPIFIAIFVLIIRIEIPEERMHFIQYGILGIMSFFVFRGEAFGLLKAILLVTIAGAIDEVIQYFLPNRVGDIRDVVFNTLGGVLGVAIAKLALQREERSV